MPACGFSGNADMYGLGIRVGFYLQWYGVLLASYLDLEEETREMLFSNALFVLATFIALVITTARDSSSLQVVEVYIILLLTFGAYATLVPVHLWRLATGFKARWDPSRFPGVVASEMFSLLYYLLLIAVGAFQLWFWFAWVPQPSRTPECPEYGFFFARIRLNEATFRGVNVAVHLGIMVVCLVNLVGLLRGWGKSGKSRELVDEKRRKVLRKMNHCVDLIVRSVVIVGTELTIWWNEIRDINSVSTAAQTIALIIGLGSVIRVLYVYFKENHKGRSWLWRSESETETPTHTTLMADLTRLRLCSAETKLPPGYKLVKKGEGKDFTVEVIKDEGEGKTPARRNEDEDEDEGEIRVLSDSEVKSV